MAFAKLIHRFALKIFWNPIGKVKGNQEIIKSFSTQNGDLPANFSIINCNHFDDFEMVLFRSNIRYTEDLPFSSVQRFSIYLQSSQWLSSWRRRDQVFANALEVVLSAL